MLSIRNSLSKSLKSEMYTHTLNSRILSIRNSLSKSLKNEIYLDTFLALREFTVGVFALIANNKLYPFLTLWNIRAYSFMNK